MVGGMKSMKTLDMMIAAEGTDDWYNAHDLWYHQNFGFVDSAIKPWPGDAFKNLNGLLALDSWKKMKPPIRMTRKEVKEKYNVVVID